MMVNPFLEQIDSSGLELIEDEIRIRQARKNLLDYELYVHPNYKVSKFHKFLCEKVQSFLEEETGHAIDILLLSVPPQH